MASNPQGKRITSENLAGQVTTTAWDCCHKVSETGPDGSMTTWDYDDEGRMIASSRLIPLDMTNVTWLTTCYEYDDLDREIATWQTNLAAHVGLPVTRTTYDQLGRVIARIDTLGNTTQTSYSIDGRTVSVLNPNTSTTLYSRSADGDTLSLTGTAVTPEFHFYTVTNIDVATLSSPSCNGETPLLHPGDPDVAEYPPSEASAEGGSMRGASSPSQISCRVHETRYGSATSARFTRTFENLLGQTVRSERSGFQGAVLATVHIYDSFGRLVSTSADFEPTTEYTYDTLGNRIATIRMVGTFPRNVRAGEVGTAPRAVHDLDAADCGRVVDASLPDDAEWRKTETVGSFTIQDGQVWLTQTNIVSCSDSTIAPLVASSSRQLTGLTPALPVRLERAEYWWESMKKSKSLQVTSHA